MALADATVAKQHQELGIAASGAIQPNHQLVSSLQVDRVEIKPDPIAPNIGGSGGNQRVWRLGQSFT